jgi:hypothetical protein
MVVTMKFLLSFATIEKEYQVGWVTERVTLSDYKNHLAGVTTFINKGMKKTKVADDDEIGLQTIDKAGKITTKVGVGRIVCRTWPTTAPERNNLCP